MGIYSEVARKHYNDSKARMLNEKYNIKKVFNESEINGFKTGLFYGGADVIVDAHDEKEARLFERLAVNDFETFKRGFDRITTPVLKEYAVRNYLSKEEILEEYGRPKITASVKKIYLQNLDEDGNRFIVRIDTSDGGKVYQEINIKEGKILGTNEMRVFSEDQSVQNIEKMKPQNTNNNSQQQNTSTSNQQNNQNSSTNNTANNNKPVTNTTNTSNNSSNTNTSSSNNNIKPQPTTSNTANNNQNK